MAMPLNVRLSVCNPVTSIESAKGPLPKTATSDVFTRASDGVCRMTMERRSNAVLDRARMNAAESSSNGGATPTCRCCICALLWCAAARSVVALELTI